MPKWAGQDRSDYFTAAEYLNGYDEVTVAKPAGTAHWTAALYYQTTSKEYVEFLRDEINGTGPFTLTEPPLAPGITTAYVAQTDPFFSTLKDWGKAIYDLWLHNGGSAPILMASIGTPTPITPPDSPTGGTAGTH